VINVAVRQQDGGRSQPVSLDNFVDALLSVLSRVDNQALRPWFGRQQVAVGSERAGGEPSYQHIVLPVLARAALFSTQAIEKPALAWYGARQDTGWAQLVSRTGNSGETTAATTVRFAKFRSTARR
jgi:hypothetical protein